MSSSILEANTSGVYPAIAILEEISCINHLIGNVNFGDDEYLWYPVCQRNVNNSMRMILLYSHINN